MLKTLNFNKWKIIAILSKYFFYFFLFLIIYFSIIRYFCLGIYYLIHKNNII